MPRSSRRVRRTAPRCQYWLVETTVPANHTGVDPQQVSVTGTTAVVFNLVDPRIILQPTISTEQRFVPNDSATIGVPAGQGTLQGGVVFELYLNEDCGGEAVYTSNSQAVSGALSQTVSSDNTTAYTTSTDMSWMVTYTSTNTGHNNVIRALHHHHRQRVNDHARRGRTTGSSTDNQVKLPPAHVSATS